ncbi:tyrosine recombinase XerC [Cereibacter sphaeroides]|uniref:site-specific integrase n=1 Tax=Cereibacter sphaeroides TaxID=1063 RepID=UPI000B77C25B|nr:tyrosine-type recombinase/integrase [Cereibacter sphaeroides]
MSGKANASKTGWRALIESYRRSDRWTGLKSRTRADYEKVLLYIEEKIGGKDVRLLTRKDVIAARDKNADRIRFANYIPQVMSVLCEHAIDIGWRSDNPAKGIRSIKTPEDKKQPHIPWTDAAVKKWREEAAQLPRLIFELGVGSVQRPADLVGFRWSDYDGDTLSLRQSKTGVALTLPCTAALNAALDGVKDKRGLTILTMQNGRPLTYRRMAEIMLAERKRLGLEAYDLHALRYRGVMELAWAGCTDDEIASYSGHTTKAMIAKYAGEARQIMRARQAREKRR